MRGARSADSWHLQHAGLWLQLAAVTKAEVPELTAQSDDMQSSECSMPGASCGHMRQIWHAPRLLLLMWFTLASTLKHSAAS